MTIHNEQPLGRMIYFLAQDIRNLAEKVLAPYELTLEQFQTLKALSPAAGLTQRQLGMEINKNPANMTRILDRLEAKELTLRRQDPADRRAYLVFLTDKGKVLMDEVIEIFNDFSNQVHQGLTVEMKRMARKVLGIMAANVRKIETARKKEQE